MYAIEFETYITDKFIEIKEYEKVANRHAKVILLFDQSEEKIGEPKTQRFKNFLESSQEVDSFMKYNRDELNER